MFPQADNSAADDLS
jgi:hypothetical protein